MMCLMVWSLMIILASWRIIWPPSENHVSRATSIRYLSPLHCSSGIHRSEMCTVALHTSKKFHNWFTQHYGTKCDYPLYRRENNCRPLPTYSFTYPRYSQKTYMLRCRDQGGPLALSTYMHFHSTVPSRSKNICMFRVAMHHQPVAYHGDHCSMDGI